MADSGAEMSSIWVEIVAEDDESDRRQFEIKMKTETRSAIDRNKVVMELSKFMLDQRLIPRGYPIGQLLDNCLIFSQSANGLVRFEPNVHQLKGSRIRIVYPLWNKILNQMSHRTSTPEVMKKHYLPILKTIPFELIPKEKESFNTFVRVDRALDKNPRPETINVIWKFVEEAIKKCDLHREANQTAGTTNDNGTDSSSSGATSSGTDAEIRSDANEPPLLQPQSSQSTASESTAAINDMRKNVDKRIVNKDHDNQEAERKRQKKADDQYNYNLILSLSQCLGQSSAEIWKRVSYKLITEYKLTDMTETETKMKFQELMITYLKVLKTAVSPFEASLAFTGFDLLNVTDLRSVVTNDVHDMIIEFKARLYPTPAVKDEVDIKVIKIDDDDNNDNDSE